MWNLGLFGTLRSKRITFPFDNVLLDYFDSQRGCWEDLLRKVQDVCRFSDEVMTLADEGSYWAHASTETPWYTEGCVSAYIAISLRKSKPLAIDYRDASQIANLTSHGIEQSLIDTLDSSLQGYFCFSSKEAPFAQRIASVLTGAKEFAFQNAISEDELNTKLSNSFIVQRWRNEIVTPDIQRGNVEGKYKDWLLQVAVPELEAL